MKRKILKPKYKCIECGKATKVGRRAKKKCLRCYSASMHSTPKYKKRASNYYKERFKELKKDPKAYKAWKEQQMNNYFKRKYGNKTNNRRRHPKTN